MANSFGPPDLNALLAQLMQGNQERKQDYFQSQAGSPYGKLGAALGLGVGRLVRGKYDPTQDPQYQAQEKKAQYYQGVNLTDPESMSNAIADLSSSGDSLAQQVALELLQGSLALDKARLGNEKTRGEITGQNENTIASRIENRRKELTDSADAIIGEAGYQPDKLKASLADLDTMIASTEASAEERRKAAIVKQKVLEKAQTFEKNQKAIQQTAATGKGKYTNVQQLENGEWAGLNKETGVLERIQSTVEGKNTATAGNARATTQAVITQEDSLRKELMDASAEQRQVLTELPRIFESAEFKNGVGDMALLYSFMRSLDPASVVREGEQEMAKKAQGWYQMLSNTVDKLEKGALFTNETRGQMAELSANLAEYYYNSLNLLQEDYVNLAESRGLTPGHVLMPSMKASTAGIEKAREIGRNLRKVDSGRNDPIDASALDIPEDL